MAIPTNNNVFNPISGPFGTGQVQFFPVSGTWTVPTGIGKARVRVWAPGGGYSQLASFLGGGSGGGFAMKTIYGFDGVTSVPVTVGLGFNTTTTSLSAGTSSFGSYVSATGGSAATGVNPVLGGTGVGGDVNTTGGSASAAATGYGGGGSASLLGNGGVSTSTNGGNSSGGGGGAGGNNTLSATPYLGGTGGFGNTGGGSFLAATGGVGAIMPQSGMNNQFSIDFIGTGGGGAYFTAGANGGGGGYAAAGGFPGGGVGNSAATAVVSYGLVIVEY